MRGQRRPLRWSRLSKALRCCKGLAAGTTPGVIQGDQGGHVAGEGPATEAAAREGWRGEILQGLESYYKNSSFSLREIGASKDSFERRQAQLV